METSFLNSVMVLSSGAATVSELHSSTRKLFSAFVRETGLLYCLCYCKNNRIVFITDITLENYLDSFSINFLLFVASGKSGFFFFPLASFLSSDKVKDNKILAKRNKIMYIPRNTCMIMYF